MLSNCVNAPLASLSLIAFHKDGLSRHLPPPLHVNLFASGSLHVFFQGSCVSLTFITLPSRQETR